MELSLAAFLWSIRCLGHELPFGMFCGNKQSAALIYLSSLIDAISTKIRIIVAAVVAWFDFYCFQPYYVLQNFPYG